MTVPIKLIVALDFDNKAAAFNLIDQLDPHQCALKVGSEMFTLFGMDFVRTLIDMQFKVFLDLKFHDIPNTVARACKAAAEAGVWMLTLHAMGGLEMMQSALRAIEPFGHTRPLLVAVTILTSMHADDLLALGINMPLQDYVSSLAHLAHKAKLNGVVSSAQEVVAIKAAFGDDFLAITPGIRRACDTVDDQMRIVTPAMALQAGSDYLVVGRPITRAAKPADALREFLLDII